MLVVTEVAEAAEEIRIHGEYESMGGELADICIRVFDIAGYLSLDLDTAIREKLEQNRHRPFLHGKKA
jgi:NTP pyrophosphatase (non-canonical NTP hydrolase)